MQFKNDEVQRYENEWQESSIFCQMRRFIFVT